MMHTSQCHAIAPSVKLRGKKTALSCVTIVQRKLATSMLTAASFVLEDVSLEELAFNLK